VDEISFLKEAKAIRKALNGLPRGLEKIYESFLKKVPPGNREAVSRCLLWLSFGARPMALDELREVIIIEKDVPDPDEDAILSDLVMLLICAVNLVAVFGVRRIATLAHLRVKEIPFVSYPQDGGSAICPICSI
jgi:hypothetical protein